MLTTDYPPPSRPHLNRHQGSLFTLFQKTHDAVPAGGLHLQQLDELDKKPFFGYLNILPVM